MEIKKYYIIHEGVRKEITAEELHHLEESKAHYTFDIHWYLSNGYVTIESIRERGEGNNEK